VNVQKECLQIIHSAKHVQGNITMLQFATIIPNAQKKIIFAKKMEICQTLELMGVLVNAAVYNILETNVNISFYSGVK
jgi:hypothetical protein